MILIYFGSSITKSKEKISVKLAYSNRIAMGDSSIFNNVIYTWWSGYIRSKLVKDTKWSTKISLYRSRVVVANFFFSTSLTQLVVTKAFVMIFYLYLSSQSLKSIWRLVKMRKDILIVISILISANKKGCLKKRDFLSLLLTKKETIIIPNVFNLLLSIFEVLILVFCIWRPRCLTKLYHIALISIHKLIRVSIIYSSNWVGYSIYEIRWNLRAIG